MFYTSNLPPHYGLPVDSGNILRLIHYWTCKCFMLRKLIFMHHCVPKCFRLQQTLFSIAYTFSLTGHWNFWCSTEFGNCKKIKHKIKSWGRVKINIFLILINFYFLLFNLSMISKQFCNKHIFPIMPSYKIFISVEIMNKKY